MTRPGDLFDAQAQGVTWPEWFRPSKSQRTCSRNVARGLHPTGLLIGPEGETCGTCQHATERARSRTWWKCGIGRDTRCAASDIRLRWRACSRWEEKP